MENPFCEVKTLVGCVIQAAAASQTDGAVCAFSKLISSVERCQADVVEVNETFPQSKRCTEEIQSCLRKAGLC